VKKVKLFASEEQARQAVREGSLRKLIVGTRTLCLANYQGSFYALSNLCPHQYASLHEGQLTAYGELVCPLHHYRFSLSDGRESRQRCSGAQTFPLVWEEGVLYLLLPE
jgi:3-phenylpropionate/trans-cinnamate dioxygenase ferredoxin subunit